MTHFFQTYPRVIKPLRNLTLLLLVTGAPYMTQLKNIFKVKIHCAVYRFITYLKISPEGAFTIAAVFLFCILVISSENTLKW